MQSSPETVDRVAGALYSHRYIGDKNLKQESWLQFKWRKPDIAEIYLENARVAIKAMEDVCTGT